MFKLVCFFFVLGWDLCSCPVECRRPPQCLNSGTGSEPAVKKGLGSSLLVWVFVSAHFVPFRYVLGKFSFVRHKTHNVPLCCISQGALHFVGPLPPLDLVASLPGLDNLPHLRFYNLSHFRAGDVHNKLPIW